MITAVSLMHAANMQFHQWEHQSEALPDIGSYSLLLLTPSEHGVGLGIGVCCLTLENAAPGIYIHSLALGSVAKMDGRLR